MSCPPIIFCNNCDFYLAPSWHEASPNGGIVAGYDAVCTSCSTSYTIEDDGSNREKCIFNLYVLKKVGTSKHRKKGKAIYSPIYAHEDTGQILIGEVKINNFYFELSECKCVECGSNNIVDWLDKNDSCPKCKTKGLWIQYD